VLNSLDFFSKFFFWYIFFATGWVFVFFKLQDRVYTFMPPLGDYLENYKQYNVLFAIVCAMRLVSMIFKIYFDQCSFELFLIDWERPKLAVHNFHDEKTGKTERQKFDVNAWRHLYLINEFNELQTYRVIGCELTLVIYALIMEGIGVTNWINANPDLTIQKQDSPRNYALFMFVTTLIVYGLGVIQYLFNFIMMPCKPPATTEFVDLCSICNISILMFDENLHGYYIHGRSPFGQAEISQEDIRKNLYFESTGKAQMRGITNEDPDL
jgi:meckelin